MGTQLPSPKRGQSPPQFLAHLYCGKTAGCIKTPLGVQVGLSPSDFVLNGDPAPYPKRGEAPHNFRPMSIVAKRLHRSKCRLVRRYASAYATLCSMWTQLPPEKKAHPPPSIFCTCLLWPNSWMDEDATWYGSRPRPRPHCTRRGPSYRERCIAAPSFRPMSTVATVAHLSYC